MHDHDSVRRQQTTADYEDRGLQGQRTTRTTTRMTMMDDHDGGRQGRQQMMTMDKDSGLQGRRRQMMTADDAKQPLSHINFTYYSQYAP